MWSHIEDIVLFEEPWRVRGSWENHAPRNDCFAFDFDLDKIASKNIIARGEVLPFGQLLDLPGWRDAHLSITAGKFDRVSAVGLCLPHALLVLVMQQAWTPLCIGGRFLTSTKERKLVRHVTGQRRFVIPAPDGAAEMSRISLEPHMFERAAALLRGEQPVVVEDEEDIGYIGPKDVLAWLDTMASQTRHGLDHLAQASRGYNLRLGARNAVRAFKIEALITSLLLAQVLKNDAMLAQAVEHSGVLLGMRPRWLGEDASRVPSKSTLSTHKFTLDCGYAVLVRSWLRELLDSGRRFFLIMLADSSPRAGREWLLMEYYLVFEDMVDSFIEAMRELIRMQKDGDVDVLKKKRLSERMHAAVWHHILIPVALGAKNMGLAAKWSAIMHAFHIEAYDWDMVRCLVLLCICLCTDYGTEAEIGIVPGFDPRGLSAAWNERSIVDDVADDDVIQGLGDELLISFARAFRIPGTDHIIHNALDQVTDHLQGFAEWYPRAKQLGKFLGSRYYVDRFVNMCLNVRGAEGIKKLVQGEVSQPYDKRFASLMKFLMDVMPMRKGLQMFF